MKEQTLVAIAVSSITVSQTVIIMTNMQQGVPGGQINLSARAIQANQCREEIHRVNCINEYEK